MAGLAGLEAVLRGEAIPTHRPVRLSFAFERRIPDVPVLRVPACFDGCDVYETAESDAAFADAEFNACDRQWQVAI
eukprot:2578058-Lingulodinium_polyedra.AAC.1